jgi:uncharacterized membrane protein SirB2
MVGSIALLKAVHVAAVTLSGAGFLARGAAKMTNARWVRERPARSIPHVVDTILLASALALAWRLRVSPLTHAWLAAKLVALVVYIGLGSYALRRVPMDAARVAAWLGALLLFAYIVSVALSKNPLGFLAH